MRAKSFAFGEPEILQTKFSKPYVAAGTWTFKNDGTWSYANGGGRWIQIEDTAIWTFNNAPGLVYTCTVSTGGLKGVMGYTSASPNSKGRFMATRAAALAAPAQDPLIGPEPQLTLSGNGTIADGVVTPEAMAQRELQPA